MTVPEVFDVAVVGGGPAGLFAVKHLLEGAGAQKILLLEMGAKVADRRCPADHLGCKDCRICAVVSGLGGAGLQSDGKLVLDLSAGGYLQDFTDLSPSERADLVRTIRDTLLAFDGKSEEGPQLSDAEKHQVNNTFEAAGFSIKLYDVLHMGTENLRKIASGLVSYLETPNPAFNSTLKIETRNEVTSLKRSSVGFELRTRHGLRRARKVIIAVGKSGAPHFWPLLVGMGVETVQRPTWVGVRVEADYKCTRELMAISFDPKISQVVGQNRVKTHCFCRNGSMLIMKYRGAVLVGGHSLYTSRNVDEIFAFRDLTGSRDTINFNVLASKYMSQETVDELLNSFTRAVGKTIAVQDMRSFLDTEAPLPNAKVPVGNGVLAETADIRSILDRYGGAGSSIALFLKNLARLYPGIISPHNRVFSPSLEWDFGSLAVSPDMETSVPGLFAVGDGAGLSQGIVHAAATGILAAMKICRDVADEFRNTET